MNKTSFDNYSSKYIETVNVFPSTSGQIPPTSGSSDGDPHKGYTGVSSVGGGG